MVKHGYALYVDGNIDYVQQDKEILCALARHFHNLPEDWQGDKVCDMRSHKTIEVASITISTKLEEV